MIANAQAAQLSDAHQREVSSGERFEFGANWARFLSVLSEDRIVAAERGLQRMLQQNRLEGLTFIDSSGLGLLVGAQKRAREHGVDLRFLPPPDRLWRTFTATGLDRVLPFTSVPA